MPLLALESRQQLFDDLPKNHDTLAKMQALLAITVDHLLHIHGDTDIYDALANTAHGHLRANEAFRLAERKALGAPLPPKRVRASAEVDVSERDYLETFGALYRVLDVVHCHFSEDENSRTLENELNAEPHGELYSKFAVSITSHHTLQPTAPGRLTQFKYFLVSAPTRETHMVLGVEPAEEPRAAAGSGPLNTV